MADRTCPLSQRLTSAETKWPPLARGNTTSGWGLEPRVEPAGALGASCTLTLPRSARTVAGHLQQEPTSQSSHFLYAVPRAMAAHPGQLR